MKTTGYESKNLTGKGQAVEKAATIKTCHPSVCVGSAAPTNCVCPAPTKK